jgi:hypothetical protein
LPRLKTSVTASADKISAFTARVVKLVDTADLKSQVFRKNSLKSVENAGFLLK